MQNDHLQRRAFITVLGAAAAWPVTARAQQPMPLIGFVSAASPDAFASRLRAFRQGLRETGLVEGRNVAVEYRWAGDRYDQFPGILAELLQRQVSVIVTTSHPAARAAKAATRSIPIVFYVGSDPVKLGLVDSLHRPGGNVTGISNISGGELGPKRLELMREIVPQTGAIGLLLNAANPTSGGQAQDMQAAARRFGLQVRVLHVSTAPEIDSAFATFREQGAGAVVIGGDIFFVSLSERLAELALHHAMPAIFQFREFVAAGGLMSYGGSFTESYRQVGTYAGRIINGENPADLPAQITTKVELIVNLRTARAMGIEIPQTLLARADEVIE
jgi:putative ABC transport system substrate-binding protein